MLAVLPLTPLLLLSPVSRAADVLAPDFSPSDAADIEVATAMTEETLRALRNRGLDIADMEILRARTGAMANHCARNPACPGYLWAPFSEAKLAVVGEAGAVLEGVAVTVRFYAFDQPAPVEELSLTVAPGAETGFALRVAERAEILLAKVSEPRPPIAVILAAPAPEPVPPPAPTPEPDPALKPEAERPSVEASDLPDTPMSLPPWDRRRLEASGLSEEEFRVKSRVRAGHTALEIFGGLAFGDVDRTYIARVAEGAEETGDPYQYTSYLNGKAPDLGIAVSHAPAAWLEAFLAVGAQVSHQEQQVSVSTPRDGGGADTKTTSFATGRALLAVISPGVRLLPLTTGPVKAYGILALPLRFAPSVPEASAQDRSFPSARGDVGIGLTLGGGLAFDAANGIFLYGEVPWTLSLTPSSRTTGGEALPTLPEEETGVGQRIVFRLGAGKRF